MFAIGIAFWILPALAAGYWMLPAKRRYLVRFGAWHGPHPSTDRTGKPLPSSEGAIDLRVSKRQWDVMWEEQTEPSLEQARKDVLRRWRIIVAWGLLGVVFPIGMSYL